MGQTAFSDSSDAGRAVRRAIVVVPTYNECDNIEALARAVLARDPRLSLLVVDDSSPDGTADVVRALAEREPRVELLSRGRPEGLGPAYKAGFRQALDRGADVVIQMDADFSHPVDKLDEMLAEIERHDLVLGSRYIKGITVINWPMGRLLLSFYGNWYTRQITGLRVADLTGGFKCWRREVLEGIRLEDVRSNGYAFQIEMTYRASRLGARIIEIPIIFADRTVGESKMNKRIALEALWIVWWLRLQDGLGRL